MSKVHVQQPTEKWRGLRTGVDASSIADEELSVATNVTFDESGGINKRKGIYIVTTETPLSMTTGFRLLGLVRRPGNNTYMYVTDNNKVIRWKNVGTFTAGNWEEIMQPGPGSIYNAVGILEYGPQSAPYGALIYRNTAVPPMVTQSYATPAGVSTAASTNATNATTATLYKSRAFAALGSDLTGYETRLNWSAPNDPSQWNAASGGGSVFINAGDGERIVSLIVYHDHLYIFKEHSIYVLNGDGDPSTWVVRLVTPFLGSAGIRTPKIINGYLYFVSGEGVYRTDGTTFDEISKPIRDVFQDRQYSVFADFDFTIAEFWQNKYIAILKETPTIAWVYDILTEAWSKWTLPAAMGSMTTTQETSPERLFFGGLNNGLIYCMGDAIYQDNGVGLAQTGSPVNYAMQIQSKNMDFKEPGKRKRNHMTGVDCAGNSNTGENLGLLYLKDGGISSPTYLRPFSTVATRQYLKFPGAGNHRTLRWFLSYTGSGFLGINSIVLDQEVKDNQESRGH